MHVQSHVHMHVMHVGSSARWLIRVLRICCPISFLALVGVALVSATLVGTFLEAQSTPQSTAQSTGTGLGTIVGQVRLSGSQNGGAPLPDVSIIVEGNRLGAVTDANGRFQIVGVPVGSHIIIAQRMGLTTERDTV